jgi:NDP-sugar pyrophosphorylase family protein
LKVAVIAGGFGKRLRPLTQDRPKVLIEVGDKTILEWQIEWLKRYNVNTFVILAGYMRDRIIEYLGSGSRLGIRTVYVVEDEPLGTGGALKNAEHVLVDGIFLAINGDILTNISVRKLVEVLENSDALAAMALVPLRSPYGVVEIDDEGFVRSFVEKPTIEQYLINAGVYAMKPEVFKYIPEKGDLERETFPTLAKMKLLKAVVFRDVYWKSIDTIKDVEEASKDLLKGLPEVEI